MQIAAMGPGNFARKTQTQTMACIITSSARVSPEESLENARTQIRRYARPRIPYAKHCLSLMTGENA